MLELNFDTIQPNKIEDERVGFESIKIAQISLSCFYKESNFFDFFFCFSFMKIKIKAFVLWK